MAATELDAGGYARRLRPAAGLVIALTALGALLATIAPALAGHTPPHPTLTGGADDAVSIGQNNLRALAAPFLLWLLKFPASPLGRHVGDGVILALTAASAIPVGLELGRWHTRLLPYLPQLPLEWAALSVAICAWLTVRHGHTSAHELAGLAATIVFLVIAAASVETWCTPHRHTQPPTGRTEVDRTREPDTPLRAGGCLRHGLCAADSCTASRSLTPFPSLRSVPLGRLSGADRATSTHRPPQGGIT